MSRKRTVRPGWSGRLQEVVTRDDGLWDVLYEALTNGLTKDDLLELYDFVRLDALDDGEGWADEGGLRGDG